MVDINDYKPAEPINSFVQTFRVIESHSELINRVLPNTSPAIAFRIKGQIGYINGNHKTNLPVTTFSGLRKSVRLINYSSNTAALIVLFSPTGISAFIRQPLYELFEESVSLDNFFPPDEILRVEECLAEANSNQSRIAIVEQFLYTKLINHKPDRLVEEAISRIHLYNGLVKIRDLADSLFISCDAFEKRFRKVTGATPKQFSSIVKMKTIIRQRRSKSSFLDTALENGFYDQSHFNRDFKIFTGQTPTDFFKSDLYW